MKKLELKNWKLRGYFNCDPFFARSRETNAMTRGVTHDMDITTPHDIYADLEKNGYIQSFHGNETNGKKRTYYRITEKGIKYYHYGGAK